MNKWVVPPSKGPRWHIVEVPSKYGLTVCFLDRLILGVWTHWDGHQVVRCASQDIEPVPGTCRWCHEGQRRGWRGHAAVFTHPFTAEKGATECVFRFPPSLGRELLVQIDELSPHHDILRGMIMEFVRVTPRDGGKAVKIARVGGRIAVPDWAPTINLRHFVTRLYKPAEAPSSNERSDA